MPAPAGTTWEEFLPSRASDRISTRLLHAATLGMARGSFAEVAAAREQIARMMFERAPEVRAIDLWLASNRSAP
jgi:hypothetical protein